MNYLQSAVDRVRSWSDEEYGQNLGVFLDEQPMLFSWLIRLSEEFDDDVHEQLVRSAMVLREGFRGMGLAIAGAAAAGADGLSPSARTSISSRSASSLDSDSASARSIRT